MTILRATRNLTRDLATIATQAILTPLLRRVTMPCAGWDDEGAGEWCMEWSWPGDEHMEASR